MRAHSLPLIALSLLALTSAVFAQITQGTSAPAAAATTPAPKSSAGEAEFGGRASSISGDPARFQKYRDLRGLYGYDAVGLVTGDIVEHSRASIVIMTTEVYRNMLLEEGGA